MTEVDKGFLKNCLSLKPKDLIIGDLEWKYLMWSIIKGKNILFIGPTRSGKTKSAISAAMALGRNDKFFKFNLGSTQDARATLIGNTMFKKDTGTIFYPSEFVRAIQTPDSIILLDELSRGHHDAWNILMPVLDPTQRYLRLDETQDSSVIPVHPTATFIATANIGNEYTATRVMDKALMFRFPVRIEMKLLDLYEEFRLLTVLYPDSTKSQKDMFHELCKISNDTKIQARMEEQKITTFIPTGTVVEMAEMVMDGFDLMEIVKMVIYPLYEEENGVDSERLYVKLIIQKYLGTDNNDPSPIKIPTT